MSANSPAPTLAFRLKNFAIGGMSGMCATCCIQPIDMVKVRIQILSGEGAASVTPMSVAKDILAKEGVKGFYRGLDAALMRQIFYTTARFGIFLNLTDYIKREKNNGQNLSLFQKGICSLTAGGLGSIVGNPSDLILVRLQADATLPEGQKRGYTSFFDAARRIPAEEGILGLWKGCSPTVVRAMSLNLGMFTTYEESKERLTKKMPNNVSLAQYMASFFAGAVAATMSLPFDNAKTKLQKQVAGADGKLQYKNIFDAMGKTVAEKGVPGLWVGLPTYIFRIAPHCMITLIISEKIKKAIL